jgi:hypothetical protein
MFLTGRRPFAIAERRSPGSAMTPRRYVCTARGDSHVCIFGDVATADVAAVPSDLSNGAPIVTFSFKR